MLRELDESNRFVPKSAEFFISTQVANAAAGGPHAWQATVRLANEAPFYVGTFATAEAAALAYNDAVAYHGLAAARRTNEVRDDGTLATKPPRSSEFYGVYRQCSKWLAKLRNYTTYGGDGAVDYIGYWESEVDAAVAVDAAIAASHPYLHHRRNFPTPADLAAARAAEAARPPRAPPEKRESRHYGVKWRPGHTLHSQGKWVASVRRLIRHGGDGGTEHLGTFDDEDAAGRAVDAFTFAHLPSFYAAAANFPGETPPARPPGAAPGAPEAAARDATGAYLI